MTTDVETLSRLSDDEITTRVHEVFTRAQDRLGWSGMIERAEDRALVYQSMDRTEAADLKALSEADKRRHQRGEDARIMSEVEHRSREISLAIDEAKTGGAHRNGHSPLLVSETHLRSHADAIRTGSVYGAVEELEHRATVTVATDLGSPGDWAAGNIREPVTLRSFSGIPNAPLRGMTAQMPSATLPAGAAGVAEGVNHTEYDQLDVANLTTLRYGRWTTVTAAADAFDELTIINRAQAVGIARDLNLLDASAIITAAGSVTAFSAAALDQNVRAGILKVCAAALVEPSDVCVFGTSAALAVVNGYSPVDGDGRGTVTTRIFGAKVYVHEPTTAGNVYMFAPTGFQVFSNRLASASQIDPKSGGNTFGQWLHSTGPGVAIVGAAAGVDVVTP